VARLARRILITTMLVALAVPAVAGAVEPTSAADSLRTGWYHDEPQLGPQTVTSGTFGQLFSTPVQGRVLAQPIVSNGRLLVATEDNWVYGLDPQTGSVAWSRSLGPAWDATATGCGDIVPRVGVTGTPVVDQATGTAYMLSKSYASGSSGPAAWYEHALDLSNGHERTGFPVKITGTAQNVPGKAFNADQQLQRPALLLLDGVVYAAFGGQCDFTPFSGWIVGVSTSGQIRSRWAATPGDGAGIWQSGGGLVSDGPGQILFVSGNWGAPDPGPGKPPPSTFGQAIARLHVNGDGSLAPSDFFSPYDANVLDSWDADFGSGSPIELPQPWFGTSEHKRLMVVAGKQGYVYLLDADDLGGRGTGPNGSDRVVDRTGPYGGVWSKAAAWPGDGGYVYLPTTSPGSSSAGTKGSLRVYRYALDGSGTPRLVLAGTSSDAFGFGSSPPIVTSDDTTSGSALVWDAWSPDRSGDGGQLRAYLPVPENGAPKLVWSAPIGQTAKFASPTASGGRIYLGTKDGHVLGFGSPVSLPLVGPQLNFDPTTVGHTSARTLELEATRDLTVNGATSSSSSFTVGSLTTGHVDEGDKVEIPVSFGPSAVGTVGATLTVSTSEGPVTIAMSGTGRDPGPHLVAEPPVVSFGGVAIGSGSTGTVVFSNVGDSPLTVNEVTTPGAPFTAVGAPAPGSVISPGSSVAVEIRLDAASLGAFSDAVAMTSSGGDAAVGLSANVAPVTGLAIHEMSVDYGSVLLGTTSSRHFLIRNNGVVPLTIMKSKPPAGGAFSAQTDLPEGTTLLIGQSRDLRVAFSPTSTGPATAGWQITANDGLGLRTVTFHGLGVDWLPYAAAPRLTRLSISPSRLHRSEAARVRWTLSKAATVRFQLERMGSGRRDCTLPGHGRCSAWSPLGEPFTRAGGDGAGWMRWRAKGLRPGRYRLVGVPLGNTRGAAARVRFRVVRG
jgi:iron transport multicopper oxidase